MKKILSKKGEGYIDVVVGILVLMMVLVVSLNIFEFMVIKQDLDEISGQLIETATFNGSFSDEFNDRAEALKEQFFQFTVTTNADEYYNYPFKRVQLGDMMEVTVSMDTHVQGFGLVKIPITVSSHRSGISEKYWK